MTTYGLQPAHQPAVNRDFPSQHAAVRQTGARASPAQTTASAVFAAQWSQTEAHLTVMTDDGDRVALSLSATSLLAATRVDSQAGGARVSGESKVSAQSVEISVSVEGELDAGEVSALAKLFRRFASALKDMFSRSPERAFQRMAKTGGLDSLAGFSYSLRREEQTLAGAAQQSFG